MKGTQPKRLMLVTRHIIEGNSTKEVNASYKEHHTFVKCTIITRAISGNLTAILGNVANIYIHKQKQIHKSFTTTTDCI